MPFINFENTPIFYEVKGTGSPVLLLHGFLESSTMWDGYRNDLSAQNSVITIDLPGHGKSGNLDEHSMDKMAEVVFAVLKTLAIENIKVIGHSMGGYVALAMAESNPKILSEIMLFFSSAAADSAVKRENRDRLIAIVKKDKDSFMRHAIPMLFAVNSRKSFAKELEQLVAEAQTLNTDGIVKTLYGLKTRPDRNHILEKDIPTSFVSGKLDEAITLESLQSQHSAKGVKKVWLTENGHMGHIEDRDFCLQAILKFIA